MTLDYLTVSLFRGGGEAASYNFDVYLLNTFGHRFANRTGNMCLSQRCYQHRADSTRHLNVELNKSEKRFRSPRGKPFTVLLRVHLLDYLRHAKLNNTFAASSCNSTGFFFFFFYGYKTTSKYLSKKKKKLINSFLITN